MVRQGSQPGSGNSEQLPVRNLLVRSAQYLTLSRYALNVKDFVAEQRSTPGDLRFANPHVNQTIITHLRHLAAYKHDPRERCNALNMLLQVDGAVPIESIPDDELQTPTKHYVGISPLLIYTRCSHILAMFLEDSVENKTSPYHASFLRLNSNGLWTILYKGGQIETVRPDNAKSWIHSYLSQLGLHSVPSTARLCGYFLIPNEMKQHLKSLPRTSLEEFPFEELCIKPVFPLDLLRDQFLEDMLDHVRKVLYSNRAADTAVMLLQVKRVLRGENLVTAAGAVATFVCPLTFPFLTNSLAYRRTVLTMKRLLYRKLEEELGEDAVQNINALKYSETDLGHLKTIFERLGRGDESSRVQLWIDLL